MQKTSMESQVVLCCPMCRSSEHVVYRRVPGQIEGYVTNQCTCMGCGKEFEYFEDREARPVE